MIPSITPGEWVLFTVLLSLNLLLMIGGVMHVNRRNRKEMDEKD